ncbi:MAG: phenylalanine--tRNA ligase subunit beta [Thermodesulfobacteriota bacterium]|nr:phenylalanine--tRNA ligase subunit beta [Thermodesulfobacteriota bacterium]
MKVSLNWLRDYVDIRMGEKELINLLTMGGLEVERATPIGEGFEKIVVAEINSVRRHPNADRLSLVEVRTAQEKFSIVCGATNIREGQRVPLALIGARLTNGVEIKKSKIRGETSEGMLCSEIELGLGKEASGIMILNPEIPLGMNLGEALGMKDMILDVSITPNRPDCLSVIGVAREIAALTHQGVKYPNSSFSDQGSEIHQRTSVTILDPDLCPRYVARMIEGIRIGPSPYWMKNRLEKVGIRSINNVVDVTNYVMMEYGQPLHAFDFELLEEGRIVVRRAQRGETFTTLDGVKRILDEEMLMICDGTKPVAVAGVMGGLNSEIREETRTVLLESAYFHPMNNRRTSRKLGLETEASYRFGRGIDYGGCLTFANRAAGLIQELTGGRLIEGVVDAYPKPIQPTPIRLSVRKVYQILGTEIPARQVRAYLKDLGINVREEEGDVLMATPPSFRGDLEREIDLIEEVARLDGFEKIPLTLPKGPPSSEERSKEFVLERKAKDLLIQHGYNEVITYSFTSYGSLDSVYLPPDDPRRKFLRILNPLTEDSSMMRTSLLPGLMETARYNLSYKNVDFKLFELKKVYLPREGERLPKEVKQLAGLAVGMEGDLHWAAGQRPIDFYDVKGCIEDIFEGLQIKGVKFNRAEDVPYLHPGKASRIVLGEEVLGFLGEVHPRVLSHYEMDGEAYLFEIDFDQTVKYAGGGRSFRPLPKFPAVYRDLSIVVDDHLEVEKAGEAIRMLRQPFIDEVTLFDVYRGAPIPGGKKSISYRIRYQANDRTLTDDEVNQHHEQVISRLREIFQAELRQ